MLRAILLGLLVAASALGQEESAEKLPIRRTVAGQSVSSAQDPKVKLTFDRAFRYVGADRFNLYNVADAEVHVFVDADANKNVKRLYWVQFEEYFANNQYK